MKGQPGRNYVVACGVTLCGQHAIRGDGNKTAAAWRVVQTPNAPTQKACPKALTAHARQQAACDVYRQLVRRHRRHLGRRRRPATPPTDTSSKTPRSRKSRTAGAQSRDTARDPALDFFFFTQPTIDSPLGFEGACPPTIVPSPLLSIHSPSAPGRAPPQSARPKQQSWCCSTRPRR